MFVTPLYAGLLALWFLVLSWRVIQRRSKGTYLGDGGDQALLRVIRGHANFAEYIPLALLMMGFLEVSRFSIYVLHALGIVLLVARLLHGYALSFTDHFSFGRMWGATLTFLVLGIEAVLCIYQGIQGQWIWCCAR
ncbi:MAG: MAPEG family protein [Pseudomonadota bacterium]|nr:MAPEG family protein [Pseudomonadota bacterium]